MSGKKNHLKKIITLLTVLALSVAPAFAAENKQENKQEKKEEKKPDKKQEKKAKEKPYKVGYVDIENVIENSFLKKNFHEEYLRRRQEMQKTKIEKETSLFQLKAELQKKMLLLGYEEYQQEVRDIQAKLTEFEAEILKIRKTLKDWENDTMAVVFDELMLVMEIISNEDNVEIIFSKEPNVIYGRSSLDYTSRVIDLLNDIDERNSVTAK